MDLKLAEIIRAECPRLFRKPIPFECNDGWFLLILELSKQLEGMCARQEAEGMCVMRAVQVKEKFAELRFYMEGVTEEARSLVFAASERSMTICEHCGEPGKVREMGNWLYTLCDEHALEIAEWRKHRFGD